MATLSSYRSRSSALMLSCSTSRTRESRLSFYRSKRRYFSSSLRSSSPVLWRELVACSNLVDLSEITRLSRCISLFFSLMASSMLLLLLFFSSSNFISRRSWSFWELSSCISWFLLSMNYLSYLISIWSRPILSYDLYIATRTSISTFSLICL